MVKTDYDLVYIRSENARMSLKEYSHYLKKSSQLLKYSLSILENTGILDKPHCIFDYSYFGLILFRVYFRGGYISEKDKVNIIKEFDNNPYVVSIYELTGEFDLAVEFASPNPSKFNKELKRLLRSVSTLNNYSVLLNLVSYVCPKNYLTKDGVLQSLNVEKIVGGDRKEEVFNRNEMKVMKNLLLAPTMRLTKLAEQSCLNVKTTNSIIKNLRKRNIIKGFRYILDTNKLNINKCRLFLRLHNLSLEKETQLTDHLLKIKETVQINKTVGDWDMEVDLEALDKSKIRYLIMQLRENFKEIIERFNLIEFYAYHKKSYLPLFLFQEEAIVEKIGELPSYSKVHK